MDVPENVLNPRLYKKAKKIADDTYKKPGLFKSAFIVKKYKNPEKKSEKKKKTRKKKNN